MNCQSCEALMINGVYCHETGCPDAWRDEVRKCKWCGSEFNPENPEQRWCDWSCVAAYHGLPDPECEHEWYDNNGRSYCLYCGIDGDA